MIKNNENNEFSNKMVSERNDLPLYNIKKEKTVKNSSKLMSDSKLKQNIFKKRNMHSLLNYSFSNKTSGNEFSKLRFESLEKQTLDLDNEINCNSIKENDVPIYINYSDYFYCPDSMKEKNLNFQIMKYLYENNLIKNINSVKTKDVKKCNKRTKSKKNKTNNIKNNLKLNEVNNLNNLNDKYKSIIFSNNNESNELNKSLKGLYNTFNDNKFLYDQSNKEQIDNNKIEYINYQDIHICKRENTIDKPKEKFYTFRTGKLFNNNKCSNLTKISSSNNSSFSQSEFKNKKSKKKKIESKKVKNDVPKKPEINHKKKTSKNKINENNKKTNKKCKLEICLNVVNEQFNVKIDKKKDKKENKDINELISVSLQSINDSKMFELAETFLPKEEDEELEKFKANEILNRKKIYK